MDLSVYSITILDKVIQVLNKLPNSNVRIETTMSRTWWNSDKFWDDEEPESLTASGMKLIYPDHYAIRVSQRRAQAVANYLVSKGIAPSRITAIGFGNYRLKTQMDEPINWTDFMGDYGQIIIEED